MMGNWQADCHVYRQHIQRWIAAAEDEGHDWRQPMIALARALLARMDAPGAWPPPDDRPPLETKEAR